MPTLIISGNHDSPERLSFGSRLMRSNQIYMSRSYEAALPPVVLEDEFGPVNFHLLPFVKPLHVQRALEKGFPKEAEAIHSYTDALRTAIAHMDVDRTKRNVLLAHQFVTGAQQSDSENRNVGGLDEVDTAVFEPFDYVALGHLHSPQKVGKQTVRYSGTPLKYSLSEARQNKSVTVVELRQKGDVALRYLPLKPLRDLREIRGTYDELTLRDTYAGTNTDDYLFVTLTDEDDIPNAIDNLRTIYSHVAALRYDNRRTSSDAQLEDAGKVQELTPSELFAQFYETQNNQPMDEGQRSLVQEVIEKIWEGAS